MADPSRLQHPQPQQSAMPTATPTAIECNLTVQALLMSTLTLKDECPKCNHPVMDHEDAAVKAAKVTSRSTETEAAQDRSQRQSPEGAWGAYMADPAKNLRGIAVECMFHQPNTDPPERAEPRFAIADTGCSVGCVVPPDVFHFICHDLRLEARESEQKPFPRVVAACITLHGDKGLRATTTLPIYEDNVEAEEGGRPILLGLPALELMNLCVLPNKSLQKMETVAHYRTYVTRNAGQKLLSQQECIALKDTKAVLKTLEK